MNYGYARASSSDQNEARQIIALKEAGIEEKSIYVDKQSGKNFDRPAWKRMKRKIKKGDVLFIKSLDRMGRDYIDVQEQWRQLNKVKGVDIVIGLMLKGWKSAVCLCSLTVSQTSSHGTSGRWMG